MKVEVACKGKRINYFNGKDWGNPFVEIPQVGDYIELGAHELKSYEQAPMKKYEVVERTFSATLSYNREYSDKKCVLEVRDCEATTVY